PAQHPHQLALDDLGLGQGDGGGGGDVVHVGRDHRVGGGDQDALHGAVGGGDQGVVDLFHRSVAAGHHLQVHHRDVRGRHADGRAVQLALQFRQHQAHGLGCAGGGGDHAEARRARAVEVLVHRIQRRLVAGVGVDGGHVAALDAKQVVQHLGHRRQAVGGAAGVRHDDVVLGEALVVDAVNNGFFNTVGGGRDQHPLGAGGQVGGG